MEEISKTLVWKYLDEGMRDLVLESYYLVDREEKHLKEPGVLPLHDYSFVVFPMAKAYEGFLKKVFFDLNLISKSQFEGDRFRIGRSLNPNLPVRYRWDWVYGRLIEYCGGETLPNEMWEVWKIARNQIFHYFAGHSGFVSLDQAKVLVDRVFGTMEKMMAGCRLG